MERGWNLPEKEESKKEKTTKAKLKYIENAGLFPAIRHLRVKQWNFDNPSAPDVRLLILLKMTGLTDVSWDSSDISMSVFQALQKRPAVRLHMECSAYSRGNEASHRLTQLENSPNLTSLHVDLTYTTADGCLGITQPLKRLLLTCPNIRKLKLDIDLPRSGCVIHSPPSKYCGMGLVGDERPPALEELEVLAFPFGREQKADTPPGWGQVGYPCPGIEEDYWAENFDWTRLRRLVTYNSRLALAMMPRLTSLKEVVLRGYRVDESTRKFYQQVPVALETISVQSIAEIGVDTLLLHGSKLRRLIIHQVAEGQPDAWRTAAVDEDALRQICEGCPHIEELELDVGRDGVWPYTTLDVLATFPKVKELTIWFELGGNGPTGTVRSPIVTSSAVQELFKYMRSKWPFGESPIRKLVIRSGAPALMGHGYPAPVAFWPRANSTSFVCTLSECDDEARQGLYTFNCPNLNTQENKYLHDLELLGKDCYEYEGKVSEQLALARDGPKPYKNPFTARPRH